MLCLAVAAANRVELASWLALVALGGGWRGRQLRAALFGVGVALLMPRPFPPNAGCSLPYRDPVAMLRTHPIDTDARLFATFSPGLLLLAEAQGIGFQDARGTASSIPVRPGDHLLVTAYDLGNHAAGLAPWLTRLEAGGWRLRACRQGAWLFERIG